MPQSVFLALQLYQNRDPDPGVFLSILRSFKEHLFSQDTSGQLLCGWLKHIHLYVFVLLFYIPLEIG